MGGKASRDKGYRSENNLVHHLRAQGWEAHRVPLSGACAGYKADVIAKRDGWEVKIEVKSRRDLFKKIYALIDAACGNSIAIVWPDLNGLLIHLSPRLEDFVDIKGTVFIQASQHELWRLKEHARAISSLHKLQKLLGEADVLALKGDRKPYIYMRFI